MISFVCTAMFSVAVAADPIDHGRDNVGFTFNIEPRFLPTYRLGLLGGELIVRAFDGERRYTLPMKDSPASRAMSVGRIRSRS